MERMGGHIMITFFLCDNYEQYDHIYGSYIGGGKDFDSLVVNAKPPLYLYFILASLVALKFVKVSSEVLAQFGKGPFFPPIVLKK
jgi:hypothetical protein